MKKICLILAIAFSSVCASAQYIIKSTIEKPSENESWEIGSFTNEIGIGYQCFDDIILGVQKSGDNYDLFARYNLNDKFYFSAQVPTENSIDGAIVGAGYSIKVWDELYVEPTYTKKWSSDDEGEFKFGLAYRF